MKTRYHILTALILSAALTTTACGNSSSSKAAENTEKQQQIDSTRTSVMDIDSLLETAETLVDQEIEFEGVCTHICTETGSKMFMMGTDNSKSLMVQAGAFGRFDAKCPRSIVRVKGIVRENRIDEAYLQAWEKELEEKAETGEETTQGGCDSEKIARGEKGGTEEERIADFRARIAQREKEENKSYLSFYYIEARSYEIQK